MVRAVAFLELKHCKLREVKFGMAEVVHGDGRRATFEPFGRALRRPKTRRLRGEDEARGRLAQLVLVAEALTVALRASSAVPHLVGTLVAPVRVRSYEPSVVAPSDSAEVFG